MKKLLTVVAVMGFVASSAGAIELSLRPNWEQEGDKVEVRLSETAVISIHIDIGGDDGNTSFASKKCSNAGLHRLTQATCVLFATPAG